MRLGPVFPLVVALLSSACGSATESDIDLTGTFAGIYTASSTPGVVYESSLQLVQAGSHVTGTLVTNAPRTASVTGTISGMNFQKPDILAKVSEGLGDAMRGLEIATLETKLAKRGW